MSVKTPKLRTRQQITMRYKEALEAQYYYQQLLKSDDRPLPRFVRDRIELELVRLEATLDAYKYCLNGVTNVG